MRTARLAALAAVAASAPAAAAPFVFSGYVEGRVGYVTNPFLNEGGSGSGLAGITLAPVLTRDTGLGKTTLSGAYDREQYFTRYGYSETIQADAAHTQQLTQRLSGTLRASYLNTNNATINGNFDPLLGDLLTVGQRSWRVSGDAALNWQATERDAFTGSANLTHVEYKGDRFLVSDYDQYSGTLGYLRTVTARTKIGANVSYVRYKSKNYPDSSSIQPGLQIEQIITPIWTFAGDIGVILQKIEGDGGTSKSLGFHGSLCGRYPRDSICLRASRASSATGIGGLSNTTSFGIDYSRSLSERDRVSVAASYDTTTYRRSIVGGLDAKFLAVNAEYSRDLSRRLSAGAGGRYQRRDTGDLGSEQSVAVTANIRLKIGRIT